jgi:serine/threonine protein kinase/tetratricopeptide (TPR) repeat protein
VTEQPGDQIGPYRLVRKLGEGGYGIVYLAEQTEPLRRRVALKVIKPGMDTRQVIARFEAERHALARMDHPGIAKVFEAGATATGRPYFVMEMVEGPRITDYCNERGLPTRARLDLFIEVCRAVQHAHQKGIIHRDLKPSNILVAFQDGKPAPKVIDFGIAKATQEPLTNETLWTSYQQLLGTPAYMSPEQAGLGEIDVDTRSDIYALGVLLYELLTGHTPFAKKELLHAGVEEMRRVIRETEPPKPSTKLSQELASAPHKSHTSHKSPSEPESASSGRISQVKELIPRVRGDLDWIVMKCLEKDRGRRYESASGLARDVERHLNDEPVTAAAPGTLYLLGKFVRRHRVGLAMAASLVLLLAAGILASTWQAVRATRAEQASRTQAAKSQQVVRFLTDMLDGVEPSKALGRDTKMLREILDHTARRVGQELNQQPEVQAELLNTLGNVYRELGEYAKADAMLRQALALRKSVFGEKDPRVADSLHDLGALLSDQGKPAEAEALFRQALAMRRELLGNEGPEVANSLDALGVALSGQSRFPEAEEIHRQALALRKRLFGEEHLDVAASMHNLASALLWEGKRSEAETSFRQVIAMRKKLLGNEHPLLAMTLGNLATTLWWENKFPEAEKVCRETLDMQRKLLGDEHPDVATALHNLARVLQSEGKLAEAESLYRQALQIREKRLGPMHAEYKSTATALAALAALRDLLPGQQRPSAPEQPPAAAAPKKGKR